MLRVVKGRGKGATQMIRKHFRVKRLVAGLAFAALLAPAAAQATPYGPGIGNSRADSDMTTQVSPYEVRGTHVLPGGMTLVTPTVARSENSLGNGGPNTIGATNPVPVPTVTTVSATSFDWSDAAIGASVAFAAALLLLTSIGVARRHRDSLARA
jgi:hypothetical protein